MASKWRIAFLHVNVAPKTLHFVEIAQMLEKRYCFIGSNLTHNLLKASILVTLGLLWLRLSESYRNFYPE